MNKEFSIYDSPFSDETKKIRLNSILASGLCLFIGLTRELPEKFSLLGISFTSDQQNILGWFIFSVSLYLFIHFVSVACIELANWIHPFYVDVMTKKELLKHPAFDGTEHIDITDPNNMQDKNDIAEHARREADWRVQNKLRHVYSMVYTKLAIEILVPFAIGSFGLFKLFQLITIA